MSAFFAVVEVSLKANSTTVKEGDSIELTVTKFGEANIPVSVLLFTCDDTAKGKAPVLHITMSVIITALLQHMKTTIHSTQLLLSHPMRAQRQ